MDRDGDIDGLVEGWRSSPPTPVARRLVDAMARHPDDARCRRILMEAARGHRDESVRRQAMARVPALTGTEVDDALIAGLVDPFPSVRRQARSTLARRMPGAVPRLTSAARANASPLVRSAALTVITEHALRDAEARASAVGLLVDRARRDDDPSVRSAAVNGLGGLNAVESRRLLIELARTDDDPTVRLQAGRALSKLDAPPTSERAIVMVLPLKNDTSDPRLDRYCAQVADLVAAEIATSGVMEVLDRAKRDAALDELKRIGSLLYDGDRPNAPQLGRFALANQIVYGVVQRTGLIYTLILNRMDVSTLKLVSGASVSIRGYRDDLDRMKTEAARRLVARFR